MYEAGRLNSFVKMSISGDKYLREERFLKKKRESFFGR